MLRVGQIAYLKMQLGKLPFAAFAILTAGLSLDGVNIAWAEQLQAPRLNGLGMPGSLSLPAARPVQDGTLAFSFDGDDVHRVGTLTFQATSRLTAAFRYGSFERARGTTYDRSFDAQFQLFREHGWMPGFAIGLRDIIGTGILASEYIVATRDIGKSLSLSGGIGWGKLGASAELGSPFGERPGFSGLGGEPGYRQWFRGPAAPFGTIDWRASDRLRLSLGWSGEDPAGLRPAGVAQLGLDWQARRGLAFGARADQAGNLGLTIQLSFNPRFAPSGLNSGRPPLAFGRPDRGLASLEPVNRLRQRLSEDGLALHGVRVDGDDAQVRVENRRFSLPAQAFGRVARALSGELDPSIEHYTIELAGPGPAASRVMLSRSDLVEFQDDPARAEMGWNGARVDAVQNWDGSRLPEPVPYELALSPYMALSMFDPIAPVRADIGAQFDGRLRIMPGLVLDGTLRARLVGNRNETDRFTNSALPPVRSDAGRYAVAGDAGAMRMALTHLSAPVSNIYTRASIGLLEEMYAGVVAEVLWKPPTSQVGLGLELAKVWQRDPGMGLGFDYYDYSTVTGHASLYYALTPEYDVRLDVGQYLAGDRGATISIDRRFANGWKIGAYATLTDVPFETFGEGSFDKGITLNIPLEWVLGRASTRQSSLLLQPIQRDGGARLEPGGRLYDAVRPAHSDDLERTWGMFWK